LADVTPRPDWRPARHGLPASWFPSSWRYSPRALSLAASVMWRHLTADPVRALLLGWRVLPGRARGWLRFAGPYGRSAVLWGAGDRQASLNLLSTSPRRLAAFALAVDRPDVARSALERMPSADPARAALMARLAWREGRYADAARVLDGAGGRHERELRASVTAELDVLTRGIPRLDRSALRRVPAGGADAAGAAVRGRVLHLVTDALPTINVGYTVRTQQIAVAQRAASLDPHVVTKAGFPVAQGHIDGRSLVEVDGVPYHRLLPYRLPPHADAAAGRGVEMAARLVERLRPAVLHAASNYLNGQLALALREAFGLPVVYEVRGFWEETWLSRHGAGLDGAGTQNESRSVSGYSSSGTGTGTVAVGPLPAADLTASDFYLRARELETRCMAEADLVVTLGEVMRAEIVARGVPADKVIVVPNAVPDEFLEPLPDAAALRESLGVRPGEQVVGVVSNLVGYEGIGTLLEAVAELRRRGASVRPLIVGDGPERAALERLAGQLGLTGTAIFTGRVPMAEVRRYHAVLDVFAIPRTNDRVCQMVTPLKPVEAMASGLPVVASDVGALREIIRPDVTGALATPGDPASFADTMEPLLYSSDHRRKLGVNAREWVARDRTWARNAAIYRAAYERLGAV
jgi:glycosyltransferase involved in cell wall biosynthesis